jgi:hypothetical protein
LVLEGTHGCACELEPAGISEFEEVVSHNDVKGFHDSLVFFCPWEKVTDGGQGMICINVCVHQDGVGSEELGAIR